MMTSRSLPSGDTSGNLRRASSIRSQRSRTCRFTPSNRSLSLAVSFLLLLYHHCRHILGAHLNSLVVADLLSISTRLRHAQPRDGRVQVAAEPLLGPSVLAILCCAPLRPAFKQVIYQEPSPWTNDTAFTHERLHWRAEGLDVFDGLARAIRLDEEPALVEAAITRDAPVQDARCLRCKLVGELRVFLAEEALGQDDK